MRERIKQVAHTEVVVDKLPLCQLCQQDPLILYQVAHYDGKTRMGPWAYMCRQCFKQYGIGLGLGKGQKLILKEEQ